MAAWKEPPDGLNPEMRHLVAELRELKDRCGLSLAALADETAYSKSSWERYLNGRKLPPRQAVEALAGLAAADPGRLLALWDLAEPGWSGRGARAPEPDSGRGGQAVGESGPESEPEPGPMPLPGPVPQRRVVLLGVGVLSALVVVIGLAVGLGWQGPADGEPPGGGPGASIGQRGAEPPKGLEAECRGATCTGRDPKAMGCGGDAWTAAVTRVGRAYIEIRYSNECRAAWGRIQWGTVGDTVEIVPDHGRVLRNHIRYDADAYTAMVGAARPAEIKACGKLTSGGRGCTRHGGSKRLREPPAMPSSPPSVR